LVVGSQYLIDIIPYSSEEKRWDGLAVNNPVRRDVCLSQVVFQ